MVKYLLETTFDNTPFGVQITGASLPTNSTEYRFSGKELQNISDYEIYDFGARRYFPKYAIWSSVDPLSETYYPISPYAYCANNPIRYIDPNGMEWAYFSINGKDEPTWNWVDGSEYHTGIKDDNGNEIILPTYDTVVVFNGSEDEKLGENDNLYGKGAVLADVIVYGPNGKDDISLFKGYTMSSDPERFGVVANGLYTVNRLKKDEKKGPYGSDLTVNNRGKVPALNNYNPAHPDRNPAYLDGVFIHRSNDSGWAGSVYSEKHQKYVTVSEGCLLILPKHWNSFYESVQHSNQFKLHVNRK